MALQVQVGGGGAEGAYDAIQDLMGGSGPRAFAALDWAIKATC